LSPNGQYFRYRTPSKLTITVACSTVLAAGAIAGVVVSRPGPAADRPTSGARLLRAGSTSAATARQARTGQSIADFESQHARGEAAASIRAVRLSVAAKAAARAKAARARKAARAAQLTAQRQAAISQAAAAPAAAATPTDAATPAAVSASGSPQRIAMSMLSSYDWSSSQFSCLDELWNRESGWNPTAANPSGAYGIPQALPGSKMASAGSDWATSATTQIKWGLGYIKAIYASPCGAWSHEETTGWY
jgi:hypothetical protein